MTTEEFVLNAAKVHGEKFDYSNVNFVGWDSKISITCPRSHIFEQSPRHHLYRKDGCPKCHPCAPITLEEFITKTKNFNMNQYNYSLITDLKSGQDKIKIICTKDNTIFTQHALSHLKSPKKCPHCKKLQMKDECINQIKSFNYNNYYIDEASFIDKQDCMIFKCERHGSFSLCPHSIIKKRFLICPKYKVNKLSRSLDKFIELSKLKHGDLFDYELTVYKNKRTKVQLKCKNGHTFWQTPESHLHVKGCPRCAGVERNSQEDFLRKAKEVHGDEYDLSQTIYTSSSKKIQIICKKHGLFSMRSVNFLMGQKCRRCNSNIFVQTQEEFLAKAKEVHLDRFDLSQIKFTRPSDNITPICKKHGIFSIQGCKFLSGRGCKKCKISEGERLIENFLKQHNVQFIFQKKFHGCKRKRELPFDFYLPEYQACIEYDGIGHYSPHVYGQKSFDSTAKSDQIKNNYCLNNGIALVRINTFKLIPIVLTELIYPITI